MIHDQTNAKEIALQEAETIKVKVKQFVVQTNFVNPTNDLHARDNRMNICDIRSHGYTLLIQLNLEVNYTFHPYLLFAIVKGYFDENGTVEIFDKIEELSVIRLDLILDTDRKIGWRNRVNENEIYTSNGITEIWLDKFLKVINPS